jgi:hypothetical protein
MLIFTGGWRRNDNAVGRGSPEPGGGREEGLLGRTDCVRSGLLDEQLPARDQCVIATLSLPSSEIAVMSDPR